MTVGNVSVDGYGLNVIEKPNAAVNGYGTGLPTGIFSGSVTGTPTADEIIESFFDELLVIDAEIEAAVQLDATVQTEELTGVAYAEMTMVGLSGARANVQYTVAATDLSSLIDAGLVTEGELSPTGTYDGDLVDIFAFNPTTSPFGATTLSRYAQTLTLPVATLTGLTVYLRINGSPTDDVIVSLYAWDGVSDPDAGTLIVSGTIPVGSIPSGTFAQLRTNVSATIPAGQYAVVLGRTGTLSNTDYFLTYNNTFGGYQGESRYRELSGTWTGDTAVAVPLTVHAILSKDQALTGTATATGTVSSTPAADDDMMGDTDEQTGVN